MNSSSTSDIILEAKDICLDFELRLYNHTGIRDAFVDLVKNPVDYITRPKDVLPVIRNLSLNLYKGDRLGLLGVNGAGKSSLCRVLCGMIKPQSGTVTCNGDVEAIFDVGTGVMPELTGRENAYLLARLFYHTKKIPTEAVEEALVFSELGSFLDAPFKTYSKGMQARLVLSLISTTPSQVLILDEVFDGADVFFKEKIAKRMVEKIEKSEAVVFVSHGPDQVLQLCNRVVVMKEGTIAFDGSPQTGIDFYIQNGGSNSFG
jgi:ABC-2 type transport system ATP-binding protein